MQTSKEFTYFNSIVVRLRRSKKLLGSEEKRNFNSIVVRLRLGLGADVANSEFGFQFYSSAIKT